MSEINLSKEEKDSNKKDNNSLVIDGKKHLTFKEKVRNFFKNPKKRLIFIGSVGIVIIAVFGLGLYLLTTDRSFNPSSDNSISPKKEQQPKLYQSVLNGTMIEDESAANRHPLAIIIENDVAARPLSGLEQADIVYETVYDPAATTRFLALFGSQEAEKVGPVRSVRTFFVDWAHGYDAFLGHWGGNIDALDKIITEKTPDLDEFKYANAYWRQKSTGVELDHTGYTATSKLRDQASKNKYSTANNFNIYRFKDDQTSDLLPDSQNITVNYSNHDYLVGFTYDKASNTYLRSIAGKPDKDAVIKNQLSAKNVVIMSVKRTQTTTRINEPGYTMTTTGSGSAEFFFDGKITKGTWKKDSTGEREMFYDENGQEITFDRGKFWICVVPNLNQVTVE